jgi:glycine hydroxymethyltransferase
MTSSIIAAKAVALKEALTEEFRRYQGQIVKNAKRLASELVNRGFDIISGGTDNHLMLVDLTKKGITGKNAETILDQAGITVNKNAIPYDENPPAITSGIRLGTPCVTTRGMKEEEMVEIAALIDDVINNSKNEGEINSLKNRVLSLCKKFPIY